MRSLLILLVFAFVACKVSNSRNIAIIDPDFHHVVANFKDSTKTHFFEECKFVSVAVRTDNTDTVVTFYSNTFLKPQYYIGQTLSGNTDVYFYSEGSVFNTGFFKMISKPIKVMDTLDSRHSYEESYLYRDGQFFLRIIQF